MPRKPLSTRDLIIAIVFAAVLTFMFAVLVDLRWDLMRYLQALIRG
jgi:hypothetical protein